MQATEKINIQVIIPVYNVEPYLEAFFQNILNQSIQNFILIAVDDASTVSSYSILKKYKIILGNRMILLQNEENKGVANTRNAALDDEEKHPAKYLKIR